MTLNWSASATDISYNVKRSTSDGGPYTTIASVAANTSYVDTTVDYGIAYYYVVSALNQWGESADSNQASVTPIAAPTGLAAAAGDQQVSLSWNASAGASSYYILHSTTPGGPYAPAGGGGYSYGTTYVDTGELVYDENYGEWYYAPLQNGVTYYYVVQARNGDCWSVYSNEVSATLVLPLPPPAPSGLTATAGDVQINLVWNASIGSSYYLVKRSIASGGPYDLLTSTSGSNFTDTGLTNGRNYYYVVSAVNSGGESPNSSQASAAPIGPPPPAAPTALSATAGDAQVSLKWNASTGATSYTVKRSVVSGGPYEVVAALTSTKFTDSGLTNGTTYYYVVSASSSHGEGPNSNQASARPTQPPPPTAPTGLSATAAKGKINLKWTQSSTTGIAGNSIYRATVSSGPYSLRFTSSNATTSYMDASVTAGVIYYYRVTALKGSQESAYSNQASAQAR